MKDKFEIKVGGEMKSVTMTFGLLNELAQKAGHLDGVTEIAVDAELRKEFLISLLSDRNDDGEITQGINLFKIDATADEVGELLEWAGSHVADFFLSSLEKTKTLLATREDRIKALMPTSDGGLG